MPTINPAALGFGVLFVAQAALLARSAWRTPPSLRFDGARGAAAWIGNALLAYAAVLYPLAGLAAGHAASELPAFGVTPCPLTLFTFGVLLHAPAVPGRLLAIPFAWSIVGGSAALLLDVPQDWPLLASGPLVLGLLLTRRLAAAPSA